MLLFGASGHAKVIVTILRSMGQEVTALFDDDLEKRLLAGISVVGTYDPAYQPEELIIISIGHNRIRQSIANQLSHRFGVARHATAVIDTSVTIGAGSVIMQGAIVQADTVLGRHVIINTGASVDHDCTIGDFVHIAPGAVLCGSVQVGNGTLIGAGSIIAPNLSIGTNCLIAAGSVVTTSIPDGAIVRGNPSRIIKKPPTSY
jgi:sugar O-acyltransferase (sialic acid O-acetyltransferase NeuD family)